MNEAKMGAQLPKTEAANGLHSIAPELLAEPHRLRFAVVMIDCGHVDTEYEIDEFGERYTTTVPRARIRAVEPLHGREAAQAEMLMHDARGRRTGRPSLPLNFTVDDIAGSGE